MDTSVQIREMAAQDVAAVDFQGTAAELGPLMGQAFGAVMDYLSVHGLYPVGPPVCFYEPLPASERPPTSFRGWAGFPVTQPVAGDGHVVARKLPGGKVATLVHTGPYETVHSGYQAMTEGAAGLGAKVDMGTGMWETYLNDPQTVAPEQLQTAIFWPVGGD